MGNERKRRARTASRPRRITKPKDEYLHPLMLRAYWDRRISADEFTMVFNHPQWCAVWKRKQAR